MEGLLIQKSKSTQQGYSHEYQSYMDRIYAIVNTFKKSADPIFNFNFPVLS